MAGIIEAAGDITLALQSHLPVPGKSASLQNVLKTTASATGGTEKGERLDDVEARDAANKFEALLIHSMLKNMRKSTMSEDKSNDRAIYDDMLDEKLADTMIEAGGIGISDQIFAQIKKQQGITTSTSPLISDAQRLKELAKHIRRPKFDIVQPSAKRPEISNNDRSTDIGHLRLAADLWRDDHRPELTQQQHNFMQSLLPHARRNAGKLGTSPSAILAVAALETGWGQSMIKDEQGNSSHNLFGIKATSSDNRYATTLTTEYIEGSPQKLQANFKKYDSTADAVDGFADFIRSNPRYENALKHAGDPERFLQELQTAGYATDPRYADKAISLMRQIARSPLSL